MNYSKRSWYDTVMDLETVSEGILHPTIKEPCTVLDTKISAAAHTKEVSLQARKKPIHILVNSSKDVMDPCNDAYLKVLYKIAEETSHQYFVFTNHLLAFIQKPLFHRKNVWTGISFSKNTGLPFGAEQLLCVFPNRNWVLHIDLNVWSDELNHMIKQGVKWLIIDCSVHHKILNTTSSLSSLELLLKHADQARVPVFMSHRLSGVPISMRRSALPDKLKARMK